MLGTASTKVSLGSLCLEEPCYGTSATAIERIDDSQPKYIRITDFDDFGIEENHKYMAAESYSSKHLLRKNDILFARTGGTVGKTYFYDGTIGDAVFAGYCIRFRFDSSKVVPKFVYWYTKTETYQNWVKGIQRPVGQPNINKEEYKSFEIILPSIAVQQQLVDLMDSTNFARQQKVSQSEALISSMSNYIHSALGISESLNEKPTIFAINSGVTKGARIDPEYHNPFYTHRVDKIKKGTHETLGNIVEFSSETWDQKDFFDATFPYVEISGVKLKENLYSATELAIQDAPSRAKMIVRNGDIIVSTTRPHRGAIATISCDEADIQIASTGFCVLRKLKRKDVLKEYLQWILLDDYVLLQMLQRSSGGNYPAITSDELKKIVIPIPDISVQKEICAEATRRKKEADKLLSDAQQEWQAAKEQFERELLGE